MIFDRSAENNESKQFLLHFTEEFFDIVKGFDLLGLWSFKGFDLLGLWPLDANEDRKGVTFFLVHIWSNVLHIFLISFYRPSGIY